MLKRAFLFAVLFTVVGCDDSSKKADGAAAKAEEEAAKKAADRKASLAKRAKDREAKVLAEKQAKEDLKKKVQEVAVIPEGAKIPKKPAKACAEVGAAQTAFMKKFHPDIEEAALTTQVGLIVKQCNEMKKTKVAMCQKYALDATTDELKGSINDYLKVCIEKYGEG